jgi:hypothetical protein
MALLVGWGTMLQAGRPRVRFPMRSLGFFNWPNPSSNTMVLGSTQPLTEMSTRNLPGGKGRPAREADLIAICEPIVYKIWEPQRLTTLWAFMACYRDSFTFLPLPIALHPAAGEPWSRNREIARITLYTIWKLLVILSGLFYSSRNISIIVILWLFNSTVHIK